MAERLGIDPSPFLMSKPFKYLRRKAFSNNMIAITIGLICPICFDLFWSLVRTVWAQGHYADRLPAPKPLSYKPKNRTFLIWLDTGAENA